jgi:hypothetical protein
MAGVAGLEPATPGFGDRCSSQLSYTPTDLSKHISSGTEAGHYPRPHRSEGATDCQTGTHPGLIPIPYLTFAVATATTPQSV